MLVSAELLLRLVQRDELRGRPADLLAAASAGALADDVPPGEVALLAAGAALAGGEPKRAARLLDASPQPAGSDEAAVEAAIRILATTLDRNWYPGGTGAVLEDGAGALTADAPWARDPSAGLVVLVAAGCVAMVPTWRSIVAGARRTGNLDRAGLVLGAVEELGHRIAAFGVPAAFAHLALVNADLLGRAGLTENAARTLQVAASTYRRIGDTSGVGAALLLQADWLAAPRSHPEVLGLDLEGPVAADGAVPDRAAARSLYEEAGRCFAATGAARGSAAVELRLALLDWSEGRHGDARAHLATAYSGSRQAGDMALHHLVAVHDALVGLDAGLPADVAGVAGAAVRWAEADGSSSFVRGLARLAHARARFLREQGNHPGARSVLGVTEAFSGRLSTAEEPALVRDEIAHLYGGANYQRAVFVLTDLDLAEKARSLRRTAAGAEALAWVQLVEKAVVSHRSAVALADPDAVASAAARLRWLVEQVPADRRAGSDAERPQPAIDILARVRPLVESAIEESAVLEPLYRARAARTRGDVEEASLRSDESLRAARAMGARGLLMQAIVLATLRRTAEALAVIDQLAVGDLPPELAAELFLRVGEAARAKRELDRAGPAAGSGPRPWEALGQRAEMHLGLGQLDDAERMAIEAVELFESHLARLTRDVLRITATDDLVVAGIYTTAIRAQLSRMGSGGGREVASSFRLSDRCRGIALADLLALDEAAGADAAVVAAVRRWNRCGAELASTFDAVAAADGVADLATTRREIAAAEAALDDAEHALATAAPALLAARRRPPPSPSLDAVQALLPSGTLLIQYHAFDDQLVLWPVTAGRARVTSRRVPTAELAGLATRYHRACATEGSGVDDRAALGAELSDLLLAPAEAELAACERVVVVPHGALALIPFHVLPRSSGLLGDTHAVSYLPAASLLARWQGGRRLPRLEGRAVVVGNPTYAPGRGLRPLPGAQTEAIAVARRLGVTPFLGAAAEAAAVRAAMPGARVLHLATHGLLYQDAPARAELTLAGHGNLTIPDLLGLDTDIDLAVLSACHSGRNRSTAAGDLIGLTRALVAGGARDLVVSLWPVDDVAGCLNMVALYDHLRTGHDVAIALRQASAGVRALDNREREQRYAALCLEASTRPGEASVGVPRDLRPVAGGGPSPAAPDHPYFWAPFVHVGL